MTSSYAWLLVLRSQRLYVYQESRKKLEELYSSLDSSLSAEARVAAEAASLPLMRTTAGNYLRSLRK